MYYEIEYAEDVTNNFARNLVEMYIMMLLLYCWTSIMERELS